MHPSDVAIPVRMTRSQTGSCATKTIALSVELALAARKFVGSLTSALSDCRATKQTELCDT